MGAWGEGAAKWRPVWEKETETPCLAFFPSESIVLTEPTTNSAWIPNTDITPITPEECANAPEKGKTKGLIEAFKIASEGHDLEYFKKVINDHNAALQQEEEAIAAREAEKQRKAQEKADKAAAKAANQKKGKRKSIAATETEGEDEGEEVTEKKKPSKKRKKDAESDEESEKVRKFFFSLASSPPSKSGVEPILRV